MDGSSDVRVQRQTATQFAWPFPLVI